MPPRRIVLIALAALALVAVALVGVRAWLLRDTTEPVDVAQVVDAAEADARVFAYATDGFEEASVLGTTRHDYPATTTITVREEGCGTTLRWDALDERRERWTICDGGPVRLDDVHSFFGRTDERTYRCRPDATGFACTRDGTARRDRVSDLGVERVEVAGTPIAARHFRLRTTMRGDTRGTGTIDVWLARDDPDLPPLRVVADNASVSDTPIGTDADYRERFELRLRALEPLQ